MTVSKLATISVPADPSNYTKGRDGYHVEKITIHHMAGVLSAKNCGGIFQNPNRNGSSHYGIGVNGEIANYVDEDNMAWTDSNRVSNKTSVTIENSNAATGGDWPISAATFESLIQLCADIARRYNLGKLVPHQNLTWHSLYASTNCPGPWLLSHMDELADRVNAVLGGEPAPKPSNDLSQYTDEQLADMVIKGQFGNGDERKQRLGDRYSAVQAIVNKRLMPNQDKKEEALPADLTGKTVVPIKLQDFRGVPLRQYDKEYTVIEDDGKTVVLGVRGAIWARLPRENVRLA